MLNWLKIRERMELIEENKWNMTVYLARKIDDAVKESWMENTIMEGIRGTFE